MIAKNCISDVVPPVRTSDTGTQALNLMDVFRISHLPILNHQEFLGVIADSDIYDLNEPEEPIGNHQLSLTKPFVREEDHIYRVLELLYVKRLTAVPVLDKADQYIGMIIMPDLVHSMVDLFAINQPGGVIVLKIRGNNYLLSEIAQIVETNHAKILSLNISPINESAEMLVTLKVNRDNLTPLIQTFERYDYTISMHYSAEEDFIDDLYESRYEALMSYLSV